MQSDEVNKGGRGNSKQEKQARNGSLLVFNAFIVQRVSSSRYPPRRVQIRPSSGDIFKFFALHSPFFFTSMHRSSCPAAPRGSPAQRVEEATDRLRARLQRRSVTASLQEETPLPVVPPLSMLSPAENLLHTSQSGLGGESLTRTSFELLSRPSGGGNVATATRHVSNSASHETSVNPGHASPSYVQNHQSTIRSIGDTFPSHSNSPRDSIHRA